MSKYDPNKHHRRSIRPPGWDYRQDGAYFVTIATHERAHLFGEVVNGAMVMSEFGRIVAEEWERTAQLRPYVRLDAFVVMPNHVHGIVWIVDDETIVVGAMRRCAPTTTPSVLPRSLGAIIRAFKSTTTRRINQIRGSLARLRELNAVREYIQSNPVNWHLDTENV
jgi:putative transposase